MIGHQEVHDTKERVRMSGKNEDRKEESKGFAIFLFGERKYYQEKNES